MQARAWSETPLQFLRYYVGRRHFTGGLMGFRYALALARAKRQRISRFIAARQ